MRLKVFKKLFLTTAVVFFVTLTLVFVILSVFLNDESAKSKYAILDESNSVICEAIVSESGKLTSTVDSLVEGLSSVNALDIYIVDNNGRILSCSCDEFENNNKCTHTSIILSDKFLSSVSVEGKLELSSVDGIYDNMRYISKKKVTADAGVSYYVVTVSNVLTINDLIKTILSMYIISAIFPLAFMFVAEYSVMYRLTRPLKYMSISAKAIANGDFSKRVPVISNDEIGELSVLFNRMTDSLSRTEMTSKSFVANVSHELKTPMTTISGFIDGIIDGTIDESRRDYYLKIVSDEVKRLSRLVQSMLSLARLESGENPLKESNFRFSEIVLSVVLSMEGKINEKNIDIVGLDSLTETDVTGDRDLLYQVVYNLVDNAVKFTEPEGLIGFSLLRFDNTLEFKIKNTGVGISQSDLPHVFERFYKTDKSRSNRKDSLGLGLYICKTITELHNGKISVDSVDGAYTEFTVLLPTNCNERI